MKTSAVIVALLLFVVALAAGQEINDNENQMQPVSEPPIKLVHVLNPGEREYLSPNLIGVQNIAMSFLPLKINFVNVIDAFREIVDGVRYEIHLNAIDAEDKNAEIICRLVILEKPWLRTEWGDKVRELQHSNCTSEEENNLANPAERSAALNEKYTRNAFFNGGSRNELSDDDMSKLESQILSSSSGVKRRATTTSSTTTTTTTTEKQQVADQHVAQASNENDSGTNNDDVDTQQLLLTASTEDSSQAEEATTQPPELSDVEMKWLDDILSVGALNFENTHRDNKKRNEAETTENNDSVDVDPDNYSQEPLANVETRTNANEDTQKQQQELELATSEQVKTDGNQ